MVRELNGVDLQLSGKVAIHVGFEEGVRGSGGSTRFREEAEPALNVGKGLGFGARGEVVFEHRESEEGEDGR